MIVIGYINSIYEKRVSFTNNSMGVTIQNDLTIFIDDLKTDRQFWIFNDWLELK